MKKVLILSASPRRGGNTDTLCDRFMQGAVEAGHQVEKIFLKDKNIAYCSGCGYCFGGATGKCTISDDAAEINQKMIDADVLVFSTPVYFYSMDAQMKTLIDRTTPRYREMANKEIYYILAAADDEIEATHRTIEAFRGFTIDCLKGAKECGIIFGGGTFMPGDVKDKPAYNQAYEMGKKV